MRNCQPTQGIVMSDIGPEQLYEHITVGVPDDEDGKRMKFQPNRIQRKMHFCCRCSLELCQV